MDRHYSDEERQAIIVSMMEATMPPLRQPGDFTLIEYVEELRKKGYSVPSSESVRGRLDRRVQAGQLDKANVLDNAAGLEVTVYRLPEEGSDTG